MGLGDKGKSGSSALSRPGVYYGGFLLLLLLPIVLIPVAILAAIFTIGGDYAIELSNGYVLVHANADEILIANPVGGVEIDAHIDRYALTGKIVTGHVKYIDRPSGFAPTVPGYFILDTADSTKMVGLDEAQWKSSLPGFGISKTPTLRQPSRYDNPANYIYLAGYLVFLGAMVYLLNAFRKRLLKLKDKANSPAPL